MTKKLLLPFLLFLVLVSKGQNEEYINGFNDLEFVDENTGFMAQDKILKTVDGGKNWYSVKNGSPKYFNDIEFPKLNVGYALIKDSLYKSTNKGETWSFITKGVKDYQSINCFDDNNCILATTDSLYKTSDGGAKWTRLNLKLNQGDGRNLYYFNDTIYLSSEYSYSKVSRDGGLTWSNAFGAQYYNLKFINSKTGIAFKRHSTSFYKTINGASSWQQIHLTIPVSMGKVYDISFFDEQNIAAICTTSVGKLTIGCSIDGGSTWKFNQYPEILQAVGFVYFSSKNKLYANGNNWNQGNTAISGYKMTNTVECFNTITSTSEIAQQKFTIYPNPTSDLLNIATENPVNYFITELGGKQVWSGFGQSVDVSSLSSGIYFLSFTQQNQLFTQKFVKQ